MTDTNIEIVDELRAIANLHLMPGVYKNRQEALGRLIEHRAANEIEKLRAERDALRAALNTLIAPQTPAAFAAAMQQARALVKGKGNGQA